MAVCLCIGFVGDRADFCKDEFFFKIFGLVSEIVFSPNICCDLLGLAVLDGICSWFPWIPEGWIVIWSSLRVDVSCIYLCVGAGSSCISLS